MIKSTGIIVEAKQIQGNSSKKFWIIYESIDYYQQNWKTERAS